MKPRKHTKKKNKKTLWFGDFLEENFQELFSQSWESAPKPAPRAVEELFLSLLDIIIVAVAQLA